MFICDGYLCLGSKEWISNINSSRLQEMSRLITYIRKRAKSFVYAFRGIRLLFVTQPNARIHAMAIGLITGLGIWLSLDTWEWCIIALCMGLVLATEAINSSIEFLTDLASPEIHPLAEKAKDLAAGAVLITVLFGAIVWALIYLPKLFSLIEATA